MSRSLSTLSKVFTYHQKSHSGVLQPRRQRRRFGLIRFRSPLLTESNSLSFPLLTKMFQFSRSCVSFPILFRKERYDSIVSGYPIQKSPVVTVVCTLPKLIAAYHVFHRLLAPRHPLYALNNLIPHSLEIGFCYISRWLLRHQFCLESEQIITDLFQP